MGVLTGLAPERVFYYFEKISCIPRGSGNTKGISDYLKKFADHHHLISVQDAANNIIIFKDGTTGYEQSAPVILHGHCDMVCEKNTDSDHDFMKDPLDLCTDGETIRAEGTTLGGDGGIAVAMILAVLESSTIPHPPIEAVVTADEELGMSGAKQLDYSLLRGRRMLNLDSGEEGIFLAGCAGSMRCSFDFGVRWDEVSADWMEISVHGLLGGHSDNEINKNRANADILLGRILYTLGEQFEYSLAELEGGTGDDVIPGFARMVIGIDSVDKAQVVDVLEEIDRQLKQEYRGSDDGISVSVQNLGEQAIPALNPRDLQRITFFLMNLPNGICKMIGELPSLVESSCNLGILKLDPYGFHGVSGVRSSIGSAGNALSDKICYLTEFLGGIFSIEGVYPAWEYLSESPFRDQMVSVYEQLNGSAPEIQVAHAGLECGLFFGELPGLECISIGPDRKNTHTTEETLSVSSTERIFRFVLEALKSMKD